MPEATAIRELARLLVPLFATVEERRAIFTAAYGPQSGLLGEIDWKGSARDFTVMALGTIINYGEIESGMPALVPLLTYLRDRRVGADQAARIDAMISQLQQAPTVLTGQSWEPRTVRVPEGSFTMGSPLDEGLSAAECPAHSVDLPDFRIGKYPVTNREYAVFIQKARYPAPNPRLWLNREPKADIDHPVTDVSWADSVAYCEWLSAETGRHYRLPSEAEWEKAARGSDGRRFPWGNAWAEGLCNTGGDATTPVNAFPDGAGPCGALDLLGNVQEWTCNLWGYQAHAPDYEYPYDPNDGRELRYPGQTPRSGQRLVHRGGSYRSSPEALRSSQRGRANPGSKISWRGFRVVMERH